MLLPVQWKRLAEQVPRRDAIGLRTVDNCGLNIGSEVIKLKKPRELRRSHPLGLCKLADGSCSVGPDELTQLGGPGQQIN